MSFTDKSLSCRECGVEFTFTAGEQEFYAMKGLLNEPQRCPACRALKRQQRLNGAPREMFTVTCSECGGVARVPFNPRNDRPVYCSPCYDKIRASQQQ